MVGRNATFLPHTKISSHTRYSHHAAAAYECSVVRAGSLLCPGCCCGALPPPLCGLGKPGVSAQETHSVNFLRAMMLDRRHADAGGGGGG
eukprot:12903791-Prorocentrum_lima.AAC.1